MKKSYLEPLSIRSFINKNALVIAKKLKSENIGFYNYNLYIKNQASAIIINSDKVRLLSRCFRLGSTPERLYQY